MCNHLGRGGISRLVFLGVVASLAVSCRADSQSGSAAGPSPSSARAFESAHFHCRRTVEGGSVGNRKPAEFEVWMRGDRAHISARSTHVLRLGTETYTWSDERSQGGKLDLPPSDERTLFGPSLDYVYRAAPCRDRGKQKTKGTVDGHPFVNYECQDALDGSTRTYYFATDLQDFPIKATILYPDRTVITYTARSLEVPATFPNSKLELPAGITFPPLKIGS